MTSEEAVAFYERYRVGLTDIGNLRVSTVELISEPGVTRWETAVFRLEGQELAGLPLYSKIYRHDRAEAAEGHEQVCGFVREGLIGAGL